MMVLLIKLVTLISTILEERQNMNPRQKTPTLQDMNPRTENAYPAIKEYVNNMIQCLMNISKCHKINVQRIDGKSKSNK